ncbi:TIGR03032 family protein [Candidatus Poribacteria bacterium]|jgi:uncharacterized protein (TIGR03032 family)|nr:TIGR03032 family protein [Candidatus Poribacteria bacterium]MBT5531601.1 TIGR03032 family protein [Candidatus Poribacteria bacterium]MBT5709786.1 TIGR03032 family protein [Candidatus Poribacteria bacterium]MBT7097021.1 TIGR03032 family protein [Candidatus Poribacteria bacterium]MBT7805744.1 TIGR03032 family protein [Candidatus Poribacteria bacterium]
MNNPPPPFNCTYSPNLPELLWQLGCTLVISTYQAGKVIFISAQDAERLVQLPRNFQTPMGLAVDGHRLAVATRNEVVVLANAPDLAESYPRQPDTYDALYMPRAVYFTGTVNTHDLAWGVDGLWAVNTLFSCLALVDDTYSFRPQWQPRFISELASEDRCHLNGMAMLDGRPRYVSALGATDTPRGWSPGKVSGGILMDVESGEVMLDGLPMPHTPRVYDDRLYLLLSATGELVCVDRDAGSYEVVAKMPGFVRGMARVGDHLFIGLSRLRTSSRTFGDLPIAKESVFSGVYVVYLPGGHIVGHLKYMTSCEEIYDLAALPGMRRPGMMGLEHEHRRGLSIPTTGFWARETEAQDASDGEDAP